MEPAGVVVRQIAPAQPVVVEGRVPGGADVALGLAIIGLRAAERAATVAVAPLQIAARAPLVGPPVRRLVRELARSGRAVRAHAQEQLELVATDAASSGAVARVLDDVLAGPLPDRAAASLAGHEVVERVVVELLASADLERLVEDALASGAAGRAVERALASPELEQAALRVIESDLAAEIAGRVARGPAVRELAATVAGSPELRAALSAQGATLGDDLAEGVRQRSERLDDGIEGAVRRIVRRPRRQPAA